MFAPRVMSPKKAAKRDGVDLSQDTRLIYQLSRFNYMNIAAATATTHLILVGGMVLKEMGYGKIILTIRIILVLCLI